MGGARQQCLAALYIALLLGQEGQKVLANINDIGDIDSNIKGENLIAMTVHDAGLLSMRTVLQIADNSHLTLAQSRSALDFQPERKLVSHTDGKPDHEAKSNGEGSNVTSSEQNSNEMNGSHTDGKFDHEAKSNGEGSNVTSSEQNSNEMNGEEDVETWSTPFSEQVPELVEKAKGALTASPALTACAFAVLSSWVAWSVSLYLGDSPDGYTKGYLLGWGGGFSEPYEPGLESRGLSVAAVLYWIVLPLSMLFAGFAADCGDGAPDWGYFVYGCFFAIHMGITSMVCMITQAPIAKLFESTTVTEIYDVQVWPALSMVLFFEALEHLDMATDTMFPGTSNACNEFITPLWLESWNQSNMPDFFLPTFESMKFGGFALAVFLSTAYIPQLLVMTPFGTVACAPIIFASIAIWASYSWILGLALLTLCPLIYGVMQYVMRSLSETRFMTTLPSTQVDIIALGQYAMIPIYVGGHYTSRQMTTLTKLVFENIIQLWLQTSAFGFMFEHFSSTGRIKALASIGLGLAVSLSKILSFGKSLFGSFLSVLFTADASEWGQLRQECLDQPCDMGFFFFLMLCFVVFAIGPWLWILAKVYFAFACDSHIWNLSSGCVQV